LPDAAGAAMVAGMLHKPNVVALLALAVLLGACGAGVRAKASASIASFLAALQRDDSRAFEAALDRPALRTDLRAQMAELAKRTGVDVGEGPSEFALDRMITPQAVRVTAARVGPGWPATPTAAQIVPHMKVRDNGAQVCLEEAATKRCLLTFAKEDAGWRLVGMLFTPPAADPAAPAAGPP
jgi:hypothetical protein